MFFSASHFASFVIMCVCVIESLFQKILGKHSQAEFGKKSAKNGRGVGVGGGVGSRFFWNKPNMEWILPE